MPREQNLSVGVAPAGGLLGVSPFDLATVLLRELSKLGSPLVAALDPGESSWVHIHPKHLGRLPFCIADARTADLVSNDGVSVSMSLWLDGLQVTGYWTKTAAEAAQLLDAFFCKQMPPSQLALAAPGAVVLEGALVAERSPAEFVKRRWQALRCSLPDELAPMSLLAPLVEAAYRNPTLRQLLPFTSHHRLCFSECIGFPYTSLPLIVPTGDGDASNVASFEVLQETVTGYGQEGPVIEQLRLGQGSAEEAVEFLVSALPAGIGPARRGTALQS